MNTARIFETRPYLAYVIVGLLAFLLYANSLSNEFALDDSAVLTQNEFVQQGLSGIPTIMSTGSWDGYDPEPKMHIYRPVQLVVLAIQYEVFALNPFGYHLVHVLSYTALCILVYWLLIRLFRDVPHGSWLALLSSVLFTAHPVHTEVVANVKGNGDLLAVLFGVMSLHFLWQHVERKQMLHLFLMGICYLLALMTKETIVCLIGVAFLMLHFFSTVSLKKTFFYLIPMLIPVGIYLGIRSLVFGDNAQELTDTVYLENVLLLADGISQELGLRLWALGKNLQLLAYPYPLVYYYGYNSVPIVEFWDIRALLPLFIYTVLGIGFLYNFKKGNIWGFAIGFYFVSMALFANIFVGIPNIVGERWLLLPSLGFCIAMAWFLILLWGNQRAISLFLVSTILFGYSGYTIQRNPVWKNNLTLSETDIKTAPESLLINGILANMLLGEAQKKGNDPALLRRSAFHYEKAIEMHPGDWQRTNNLGIVYEELNEYSKAAKTFAKAKALESPIKGKASFSEAKNWYLAKEYNRALAAWNEVDSAYPNNPDVAYYLALTHEALGNRDKSIHYYQRLLDLTSDPEASGRHASIRQQAREKVAESK